MKLPRAVLLLTLLTLSAVVSFASAAASATVASAVSSTSELPVATHVAYVDLGGKHYFSNVSECMPEKLKKMKNDENIVLLSLGLFGVVFSLVFAAWSDASWPKWPLLLAHVAAIWYQLDMDNQIMRCRDPGQYSQHEARMSLIGGLAKSWGPASAAFLAYSKGKECKAWLQRWVPFFLRGHWIRSLDHRNAAYLRYAIGLGGVWFRSFAPPRRRGQKGKQPVEADDDRLINPWGEGSSKVVRRRSAYSSRGWQSQMA